MYPGIEDIHTALLQPLQVRKLQRLTNTKRNRHAPTFEALPWIVTEAIRTPLGWALSVKYFSTTAALQQRGGITKFWNAIAFPRELASGIDVHEHRLCALQVLPSIFQILFNGGADITFDGSDVTFLVETVRMYMSELTMPENMQIGRVEKELFVQRCSNALNNRFVPLFSRCSLPQMLAKNEPFPGSYLFSRLQMLQFIMKGGLFSIAH